MTVVVAVVAPERAVVAAAVAGLTGLLSLRYRALFGRDGLFGILAVGSAALAAVFLSIA